MAKEKSIITLSPGHHCHHDCRCWCRCWLGKTAAEKLDTFKSGNWHRHSPRRQIGLLSSYGYSAKWQVYTI